MPVITLKKTGNTRIATYGIAGLIGNLVQFSQNQPKCLTFANIGNGTTAGRLRTNAAISYSINGQIYTKASTDDFWNLSALTALTATQFRAHALCILANGNAALINGPVATTSDAALEGLTWDLIEESRVVVGIYVAGNSTDYTAALAAQGTIVHGWPNAPAFVSIDLI
jgi:hypothetical protein